MRAATKEKNFDAQLLEGALQRFSEASSRLETRYETLRIEAEELRRQLLIKEEEIKRSQKLATLGETAAGLAHEVRNPLGAIKLFLGLLKEDLEGKERPLELVTHIERSVNNLDSVVTNILQFAQDSTLVMSPMNLHALIEAELSSFSLMCEGKNISFSRMLSANPFIIANEDALRQVLHNLIINSVQALKNSGEIRIISKDIQHLDGRDGIELIVADNGQGIAEEMRSRIFEPFVTGRQEGTGLGLAIVKKLIVKHGGEIEVSSERGAKFSIFLPRRAVLERSEKGLQ